MAEFERDEWEKEDLQVGIKVKIVGLISGHAGSDMRWLINADLALILRSEDAGGEVPLPKAKVA